jgi:hypothetical protein
MGSEQSSSQKPYLRRDMDLGVIGFARSFEDEPHIFKHGATLRFDVVANHIAG